MPLVEALLHCHEDLVYFLLDNSADPNLRDVRWGFPLEVLAGNAYSSSGELATLFRRLIESGARLSRTTYPTAEAVLQVAAVHGDVPLATLLIENSADVNSELFSISSACYQTLLETASSWGHVDMITLLIKSGASTNGLHYLRALQFAGDNEHFTAKTYLEALALQSGVCPD